MSDDEWLEDDMGSEEGDEEDYESDDSGGGGAASSHNLRSGKRPNDIDSYIKNKVSSVLRLAEWASRTTQAYTPDGKKEVDDIKREMDELRFYAPSARSASWKPEFSTLVNFAHSFRVTPITPALKKKMRNGGQRFYDDIGNRTREDSHLRCVLCNSKEHNSKWCVDLAGNAEWWTRSYDAREFLEKPREWGGLFDKAMKRHGEIFEPDWAPGDDMCMPSEFMGSFAVGETCLQHLISSVAAQNMPFESIYKSMSMLRESEPDTPEFDEMYTVNDQRIFEWCDQKNRIQTSIATKGKAAQKPKVAYCEELWAKLDTAITESVGDRDLGSFYERCGYWAATSMERAKEMSTREKVNGRTFYPGARGDTRPAAEEDSGQSRKRPRARHSRVVLSDDDDEEVSAERVAPPPREATTSLPDVVSAASELRSLVSGPSPENRLLRGYATTIAELFDLARVLTEKELHVEAGVAGRGAIVLQELSAKYQEERAR
jgi:hypothetical protein